jgi:hypothetical protein
MKQVVYTCAERTIRLCGKEQLILSAEIGDTSKRKRQLCWILKNERSLSKERA